MSDSSEAKRIRRAREAALATAPGANGLWNLADLRARMDAGVDLPVGAKFSWTNLRDFLDTGIGGGGSPVESQGLEEFLASSGMTPQQFQAQYGGLPLVFNADGTVTYDPSAQRQAFEYTPASYGRNAMIGLGGIAALTGAGLMGLGGAGSLSGLSQAELAALIESGTTGAAGAGIEAAAGIGTGAAAGSGGLMQSLAQTATGTGGLSEAELAALIESGTTGIAGSVIETAGGVGTASLGDIVTTGLSNLTGIGGSVINGAASLMNPVTGSGGGSAATTTAAGSALSRILDGTATTADWVETFGKVAGAGIGWLGSKEQTDAMRELQSQLNSQRAPFLNKALGYLNDPNSFYGSPEATGAADATLRALSTRYGNPGVSPTAQALTTGALYDRYQNTVNSLGSLGLSGQGIQANLGQQIAQGNSQPYAIGGNLIAGLTSDTPDISGLIARAMRQQFPLP